MVGFSFTRTDRGERAENLVDFRQMYSSDIRLIFFMYLRISVIRISGFPFVVSRVVGSVEVKVRLIVQEREKTCCPFTLVSRRISAV